MSEERAVIVATRFVDFVLKHNWEDINGFLASEVQVFFDIVSAAGFEPREVTQGKLVGHYPDEEMRPTSKTYPINELCPFKVMNQNGEDDYRATEWLDLALRYVSYAEGPLTQESRGKCIAVIVDEIEWSIPLEPIQLTDYGDELCELAPKRSLNNYFGKFFKHTRDDDEIRPPEALVGIHRYCGGAMHRVRATRDYDVLLCLKCFLRVPISTGIKTYGELRKYEETQRVIEVMRRPE